MSLVRLLHTCGGSLSVAPFWILVRWYLHSSLDVYSQDNAEATRHMSQLINRNNGTPIPIDIYQNAGRKSDASLDTGCVLSVSMLRHYANVAVGDIRFFLMTWCRTSNASRNRTSRIATFPHTRPDSSSSAQSPSLKSWPGRRCVTFTYLRMESRLKPAKQTAITVPLLNLNRALHKDAVKTFKVIQRLMGDRERERTGGYPSSPVKSFNGSTTSLPRMSTNALVEEERWLLGEGLSHGELRDEIYCQVMKQLNGNPSKCVSSTRSTCATMSDNHHP